MIKEQSSLQEFIPKTSIYNIHNITRTVNCKKKFKIRLESLHTEHDKKADDDICI